MANTHVIGISGSLRSESYNTALLRAAFERLPEGVTSEIADISDIALYNADDAVDGRPASVEALRTLVRSADGIVFASPEYNWSVTGAMKNAVDWLSLGPDSPLDFKPAAIAGAGGGSGTARSQEHLRDILAHNNLCIVADPQVMVSGARERFVAGELVDDDVRSELASMLERLLDVIERARSTERLALRGSILVVGSDEPRAGEAARSIVEMGHRTLRAIAAVDAVRILSRRAIAGVAVDGHLNKEAKQAVRAGADRLPFIEFDAATEAGRAIDAAIRFDMGSQ